MDATWLEALPLLRQKFGDRNFATWIEPIRCSRDEHGLRLEVKSRFFQEWVTRHFLSCIRQMLRSASGTVPDVRVVVAANGEATSVAPPAATPPAPAPSSRSRTPKIGRLVAEYTFDSFVVGQANEVAYRAAQSVAEFPGRRFNPFFLWGGVGLGKTHLINALAHDLLGRPPRPRMACLAAEAFMNSLITSLRQDQMAAFRDRFREVDVLILDDVEFLAGKERTQEEFFHTFNALYSAGKQVVLTSDKPPHAIAGLEERLRSRFEGGLIADIHPPTHAMRVAIVTKKAAHHGVDLPAEVAFALAQRSGSSVRELEGALTRVLATANLKGVGLDRELVERVLAPVTRPINPPSADAILEVVGQHFRLSVADLKSHRRARTVVFPRQLAMYLVRTVTDVSFPSIGDLFGGRDHSTVMHAVRAVETKREHDPQTDALVSTLESELRSRMH
jgi:chromosomal replication initiator protein